MIKRYSCVHIFLHRSEGVFMSKGHGAKATLICSDDSGLLYSYSCYDLNREGWQQVRDTEDGEIWIARDALTEPEIHEKLKRLPSGRKKMIIKRIPRPVPFDQLFEAGKIRISNAGGNWETESQNDTMSMRVLFRIYDEYQLQGKPPEHIFIFY